MFKDIAISEQYGSTLNKQHPFYVDSVIKKHFAFHVFVSFAIIDLIKKFIKPGQRNYLVDATFKIAPRQFKQLLILSIEYKKQVCCCIRSYYSTYGFHGFWSYQNYYGNIVQFFFSDISSMLRFNVFKNCRMLSGRFQIH